MTDAEKELFQEMRAMRTESNDNFVLLHKKVDKQESRLTRTETKLKILFPIFTLFFVSIIDYLKVKLGFKG